MKMTQQARSCHLAAALASGFADAWRRGQSPGTAASGPQTGQRLRRNGSSRPAALTDRPEDEKAIRAVGDAFTRSFAAGDAKAVAAMFSEDAELIDENGERIEGATAIEEFYTAIFPGAGPARRSRSSIDSLRFLSPDVAKEEGHTRVKSAGEPETLRRYTVLYVKQRWAMAVFQRARRARRRRRASRASEAAGVAGRRMARPELGFDGSRHLPLVGGQELPAPRLHGPRAGPAR